MTENNSTPRDDEQPQGSEPVDPAVPPAPPAPDAPPPFAAPQAGAPESPDVASQGAPPPPFPNGGPAPAPGDPAQQGQYTPPPPYAQQGQYPQQGQYGQPGQYPQQGQYGQPGQYPQQGQYPHQGGAEQPPKSGTLSVIALVLSLLALITSTFGLFAFVSWFFGLPAFIIAIVALVKKSSKRGQAIAALIVSVIAFLVSIVMFIVGLVQLAEEQEGSVPAPAFTSEPADPDVTDDDDDTDVAVPADPGTVTAGDAEVVNSIGTEDLRIVEATVIQRDPYWPFVVIVENTSTDYMWTFARFNVEAFNADGVLLNGSPQYTTVLPGQTLAISGMFYDVGDNDIASIEITMEDEGELVTGEEFGSFEVSDPEYDNGDFQTTMSGTISSTFVEDQEYVTVVALVRDADGNVVAIDDDLVTRVPAGGTARYEINVWDFTIDDSMTLEVYSAF